MTSLYRVFALLLTVVSLLAIPSVGAANPNITELSPQITTLTITTPEGRVWRERIEQPTAIEGVAAPSPADESSSALDLLADEISATAPSSPSYSNVSVIDGTKRRDCSVTSAPARPANGWPALVAIGLLMTLTTARRRA